MNKINNNVMTLQLHYIKNFNLNVRTSRELWESFKEKARELGYKPSEMVNLFINSVVSGKYNVEGRVTQVNLNLTPVRQVMQQNIDIKEYITESELNKWFQIAEKIQQQDGRIPPQTRRRILKIASKLRRPRPETFEKIRKITEF